jgi:DNA polymerase III sliding clamp (beta) subunit (PCNA family)
MKYSQALKGMWCGASKEESRYTLRAVYIDADKKAAVVTDGHLLAIMDVSDLLEDEEKSFLIPVDALRAADALFVKFKPRTAKAKAPDVFIRAAEDSVTVSVGGSRRSQSFDKMHGQFPQWAAVFPKETEKYTTSIFLSEELLLSLAKSLAGTEKRSSGICLSVCDDKSVILVTRQSSMMGGRKSCGLLMPMRDYSGAKASAFWNQAVQA